MKASPPKLSVLIVDDNEPVCRAMRVSPIWASLPARVVATATSSEDAKVLIRRYRPDILITDIKIPGSDGMELARYARSEFSECRVIFITAHDEFELAQKAVRVDASDFLLKPILDDEVARAVRKIAAELLDRREKGREVELLRARYGAIEERFESMETQAREKLVSDLLRGAIEDKQTARDRMSKLAMRLHRYRVLVAVDFRTTERDGRPQPEAQRAIELLSPSDNRKEVANLLSTAIDGRSVVVVDFHDGCTEGRAAEILGALAAEMEGAAKRRTGNADTVSERTPRSERMAFGASASHSEPLSLHRAYEEAVVAADQRFFDPERDLHFFSELSPATSFREDRLHRHEEALAAGFASLIPTMRYESIDRMIDEYFDELLRARALGRPYAESKLRLLLESLKSVVGENKRTPVPVNVDTVGTSFRSLDEARDAVRAIGRAASTHVKNGGALQRHHIELVTEFFEARYSEPIRLIDVARVVGLSPSHLSRLIKSTTGQTFTELLTSFRLKVATRLLKETNAKVYEIADMVGMKNHAYFYQVFRKYTGVSPNELR